VVVGVISNIIELKTMNQLVKISLILLIVHLSFQPNGFAQTTSTPNEVRTEIIIEGSPQQIWDLILDFKEYPNWHPYLSEVLGKVKKGKFLKFKTKDLDGNPEGKFTAKIMELELHKELSWGGNVLFFFSAKHYFRLVKIDETNNKLIKGEYWKGVFGKSYGEKIYIDLTKKFIQLNITVKNIIES